MTSTGRLRSWRGVPVAVLLIAALGMTGLLAMAALTTERYQRAQAQRVLTDYAVFAAQSYSVRAAQQLFYAFGPALDAIGRERRRTALPGVRAMAAGLLPAAAAMLGAADAVFAAHELGPLRIRGADSIEIGNWLGDQLRSHVPQYGPMWQFALLAVGADSSARIVVYRLTRETDDGRWDAWGFIARPAAFAPPLRAAYENMPLLPVALAGDIEKAELGTVRVRVPGAELFRSGPWDDTLFVGRARIGDYFGETEIEVALRSSAAGRLIIGGLPRSRLPFIVGLFALTAALVAWAMVQLMRERELARLRSDFVAGVSHELRTPLAQVRMFAETLLLDRVRNDDERRRSLAIIDQEARRLTHLVDNILHFTRTERVALKLAPRRMPLAPLLRDVVEGFRPLADQRGTTIELEAPDDLEVPVDEAALRQVLINLLDNAVKYGPEAQRISVALSATPGEARLSVEDQGPGVPAKDRERVWQRFVRLERDRGTAVAGTGIGLAVVHDLVRLHGGRCWIEQAAAGGTRVMVSLPLNGAGA